MSNENKLFNKNFLLLWQGQFVSQMGSQAFAIAVLFWTKHQTDSGTLVGIILMLSLLPQILLSPIGGTFADHHSRKKIIVACDLLGGIFMVGLAGAFFLFPDAGSLLFAGVMLSSIVVSAIKAFFNPAVAAAIPDLVPPKQVAAGNSSMQILVQLSSIAGLGLGGILFTLLGAPLLFLINGISFLFSGFSEFFIKIPQLAKDKDTKRSVASFKKDTIEGFRHILDHKGLKATFWVFALLNFFVSPIFVILPFYVEEALHAQADWYGYIAGIFAAGSVIGYILVSAIKFVGTARRNAIVAAFSTSAIIIMVLSAIQTLWIALVGFGLLGVFNGFININMLTQIQMSIKSEMRGRIMGSFMTLTAGVAPIALAVSGVILDLLDQNVRIMLLACGTALLLLSIMTIFNKNFLTFLATLPEETTPAGIGNDEEEVILAGEVQS